MPSSKTTEYIITSDVALINISTRVIPSPNLVFAFFVTRQIFVVEPVKDYENVEFEMQPHSTLVRIE